MKSLLFTAFVIYGLAGILLVTDQPETIAAPISTPNTISLQMLSMEQMEDRAEELTTSTTASTSTTTTTIPLVPVADVDPSTHCQEWFPLAISVGWPNETEVLEKLGRVLFKETRCLNVTPLSDDPELAARFNGSDWGVAQVNERAHHDYVEQLYGLPFDVAMSDPALNLQFAYKLYSDRENSGRCGWQPWSLPCR